MSYVLSRLKAALAKRWKRSIKRSMDFHDMASRAANLRRAGVTAYMARCGSRLRDILPTYYRRLDGALWQG